MLTYVVRVRIGAPCLLGRTLRELLHKRKRTTDSVVRFASCIIRHNDSGRVTCTTDGTTLSGVAHSFTHGLTPRIGIGSVTPSLVLFGRRSSTRCQRRTLGGSLVGATPNRGRIVSLISCLLADYFIAKHDFPLSNNHRLHWYDFVRRVVGARTLVPRRTARPAGTTNGHVVPIGCRDSAEWAG